MAIIFAFYPYCQKFTRGIRFLLRCHDMLPCLFLLAPEGYYAMGRLVLAAAGLARQQTGHVGGETGQHLGWVPGSDRQAGRRFCTAVTCASHFRIARSPPPLVARPLASVLDICRGGSDVTTVSAQNRRLHWQRFR